MFSRAEALQHTYIFRLWVTFHHLHVCVHRNTAGGRGSHQCVLCTASELRYRCSEEGQGSQGAEHRVQKKGQAVGHAHQVLQKCKRPEEAGISCSYTYLKVTIEIQYLLDIHIFTPLCPVYSAFAAAPFFMHCTVPTWSKS